MNRFFVLAVLALSVASACADGVARVPVGDARELMVAAIDSMRRFFGVSLRSSA